MKTILLLLLAFQLSAQNYYCIQIMSTRNPHLIKPEMVTMLPDSAMVEDTGGWYRIMFIYEDLETAEIMLTSWQRAHKEAFIVVRRREQVRKMYRLFSEN